MIRLTITETTDGAEAMADLLEHIAAQLRDGFTSGYYPHWTTEEVTDA